MLYHWTARELANRGWSADGEIFLFTSADPVLTSPVSFFFDPLWYQTSRELPSPVPLLDWPEDATQQTPTAYA
jgi:hypothetical protein